MYRFLLCPSNWTEGSEMPNTLRRACFCPCRNAVRLSWISPQPLQLRIQSSGAVRHSRLSLHPASLHREFQIALALLPPNYQRISYYECTCLMPLVLVYVALHVITVCIALITKIARFPSPHPRVEL